MQYSNSNIDIPNRDTDSKQYYCYLYNTDPEEFYRLLVEELPELLIKGYEEAS